MRLVNVPWWKSLAFCGRAQFRKIKTNRSEVERRKYDYKEKMADKRFASQDRLFSLGYLCWTVYFWKIDELFELGFMVWMFMFAALVSGKFNSSTNFCSMLLSLLASLLEEIQLLQPKVWFLLLVFQDCNGPRNKR